MEALTLLPVGVAGYLIGSIPTGVILARLFGWPDPRTHGSGHTGALNVSRRAGRVGLITVLIADLLKGVAAALLGSLMSTSPWAATIAGLMAVIGHCYPAWLRFQGGMGLATGMGAMITQSWLIGVIAAALLGIIRLAIIRHTPRATILASVLLIPIAALISPSLPVFALVAGVAALIAARHIIDWNRKYE